MDISDQEFDAANRRGQLKKARYPATIAVLYDSDRARLLIALESGLELTISPQLLQGLEHATALDLAEVEISASGFGIHFPRLDADIDVPSLLHGIRGTAAWMAEHTNKTASTA